MKPQDVLKKLNVGKIKDAEWEALHYGQHADAFMDGFRHARNNLQKQKDELIKLLSQ